MVAITDKNAGLDPRCGKRSRPGTPRPTDVSCTGSVPPVSIAGPAAGRRPTASPSSTGLSRPRPPGSGPANAACPTRKPPAPVWSAGSANTSKSDRTNHVPCPPWRNWARWLATVLHTCSGRSKRPPGSRRNSTRQPGVSTGSRRWSKTGKTSQQRFMKRRSVRPAGCTRPRRSIWA